MAFNIIDRMCNIEKCKESSSLSDEHMFSSNLDMESMEPNGWDFNSDDWGIDFEGKLLSTLEELNEERGLNQKYECFLAKSKGRE